jgi:hypothetical protein
MTLPPPDPSRPSAATAGISLLPFALVGLLALLLGMAAAGWRVHHFALTALFLDMGQLGLVKRGLLGTLMAPLLPDRIHLQTARAIWIGLGLGVGSLICLAISALRRNRDPALALVALASPALFLQLGFNFSFLDLFALACLLAGLLLLNQPQPAAASPGASLLPLALLLALVVLVGGLFHEVFLVAFAPLLLLLAWRRSPWLALPAALFAALLAALLAHAGRYEPGEALLNLQLARHYLEPFRPNTIELTTDLATNLRQTIASLGQGAILRSAGGWLYLLLLLRCLHGRQPAGGAALVAAALMPLLLVPLGTDTSRWLGFAATNLLLLALAGRLSLRLGPAALASLLPFSLLGPLGIQGSFPLLGRLLRQLLPLSP